MGLARRHGQLTLSEKTFDGPGVGKSTLRVDHSLSPRGVANDPPPPPRPCKLTLFRNTTVASVTIVISLAAASVANACQPNPAPTVDDPCSPAVPSLRQGAKVAHMELRGTTGIGALVLDDGTLVSLDFASGEIVFRPPNVSEIRVHRDLLPPEARAQFIQLASRVVTNPNFSFEAGTGTPPANPTAPVEVPRWGYPLRESMFSFRDRIFLKDGADDESPCARDPGRCRPPRMLATIEVTGFSVSESSSSARFDMWWARNSDPRPVLSPNDISALFDQAIVDYDRTKWEGWRQRRCADAATYAQQAGAATVFLAPSCALIKTGVGALVCGASAVALIHAMSGQADATSACLGPYPGPGGWP